jgi:tetratricopeptide (TPR) repeat protein
MPTQWSSCSVFVSSTFDDMHAERDHLQQFVFPELEEILRQRRIHLETTDLRWGVETMSIGEQEAKELTVLKVCLAEIDRSRPFLLVLLGDRYGWIPPAGRIESVASEVGLAVGSTPWSVTALEVEYGALLTSQHVRPLFYFRDPLPYAQIPPEVAARYTDQGTAPEHFGFLADLKARIRARYPDRVRSYSLGWDADQRRPARLSEFGALVLHDLEAELEAETAAVEQPAGAATDWREDEERALDDFIEDHLRSACGRQSLVEQIINKAVPGSSAEGRWPGTVLVGDSGAGKSVVFAMLARRLLDLDGVLLLKHSAGVSPRSLVVDSMLRRWCGSLALSLGSSDESEQLPAGETLRARFNELLEQAAAGTRVVILIDALDQFERTPEASYLTWLPDRRAWPANVVMIATAISGTESRVLDGRGAEEISLPPLEPEEAAFIAMQICASYHKTLPQAVTTALLGKPLPDGGSASGNPLWLSLAVNELLVLDVEDFALLPGFPGTAEERLLHLLVQVVDSMPATLDAAYAHVYARVEKDYGRELVTHVMTFLSLSRFGLRESDLRDLFGSRTQWSPSSFAALRRALRAHIGERGKAREWAFLHQQGRRAALNRYAADPDISRADHRRLGEYLRALPAADPLRHETMYHLIQSDAREAARDYWHDENGDELQPAFDILSQTLLAPAGEAKIPFVLSLLGGENGSSSDDWTRVGSYLAGQRLLQFTEVSGLSEKAPRLLISLLTGMTDALQRELRTLPSGMTAEVLYRALQNLGRLHADLDDNDAAARALEEAAQINDRLAEARKRALDSNTTASEAVRAGQTIMYHQAEKDRMLNFQLLGSVHRARKDLEQASAAFERARQLAQFLLAAHPESMLAATDMASCRFLLGDVAFDRGDFDGALAHYDAGLQQALRPFEETPSRALVRMRIEGEYLVGRAQARRLALGPALDHYARSVKLARDWAKSDPGDGQRQWRFLRINDEAADFLGLVHGAGAALLCYDNGLEICIAMLNAGHDSTGVTQHARRCYEQQAIAREVLGDARGAEIAASRAQQIGGRVD